MHTHTHMHTHTYTHTHTHTHTHTSSCITNHIWMYVVREEPHVLFASTWGQCVLDLSCTCTCLHIRAAVYVWVSSFTAFSIDALLFPEGTSLWACYSVHTSISLHLSTDTWHFMQKTKLHKQPFSLCAYTTARCRSYPMPTHSYRNLSNKRPWAFEIYGQKTGVSVYTEKPFVRITHIHANHRISKNGGWAITRSCALTRENTFVMYTH